MRPRSNPIREALVKLSPEWDEKFGMPVALHIGDPAQEAAALQDLALADLSALPKVGCKGQGAEAWLRDQGLPAPKEIYGWDCLDGGGIVARSDRFEFVIWNGFDGGPVEDLSDALRAEIPGVYRVERQDACFLIAGARALDVLAQTCGVNFAETDDVLVKTRIAVTSCTVKRVELGEIPAYRLWCEPSYGVYLWTALQEIVEELGGRPVGWACVEHAAPA